MEILPTNVAQPVYDQLGLKFSKEQQAVIDCTNRFMVVVGGERGGKSFTTGAKMTPQIAIFPVLYPDALMVTEHGKKRPFNPQRDKPRNPHFLLFGPTYAEPRIEFQHIENWLMDMGLLCTDGINKPSKPQDGPWRMVTKAGVVIATWSMEDPRSIRAVDLYGAAVCEAGKCPWDGIERVQGRVSAKRGFVIYSGTMENAQQWYQDWALMGNRENNYGIVSFSLPTWTNLHEFPGGREDPEIKRLEAFYPEDIFAMRVAAEPRPPRFRVLQEVTNKHIRSRRIPRDANIEVWTDPGYASAYALLWVAWWYEGEGDERRKVFHIFDEFYEQGKTTPVIVDMCKRHKQWRRVEDGVIDVAGKGHRDAGESALEIWKRLTGLNWNMRYWKEDQLMERIRTSARTNQFTIDPKCVGLIAECGLGEPVFPEMHPWRYPTDRDGRVISEKPIDKWNHSAKALGYGLLHHLRPVEGLAKSKTRSRLGKASDAKKAGGRSIFARRR